MKNNHFGLTHGDGEQEDEDEDDEDDDDDDEREYFLLRLVIFLEFLLVDGNVDAGMDLALLLSNFTISAVCFSFASPVLPLTCCSLSLFNSHLFLPFILMLFFY